MHVQNPPLQQNQPNQTINNKTIKPQTKRERKTTTLQTKHNNPNYPVNMHIKHQTFNKQ